jgi:predicted small lipoprotein YifL
MNTKSWVLALAAATLLAACGGGGDLAQPPAAQPPTAQVPATATASVGGYVGYLKALVASMADTLEPVDVNAVKPPTSEATEPDQLS